MSAPGAPDTAYTNNLGTARSQQARLAASRQEVPTNLEHGKLYGESLKPVSQLNLQIQLESSLIMQKLMWVAFWYAGRMGSNHAGFMPCDTSCSPHAAGAGLSNGTLGEWDKVKQGVECGERLLRQCHAKEPAGCCCHQEGDCSACNGGANGGHTEGDGHTKHCSVPWEELFTVLLGDTARDESQRPAGVRVAPVTDALRSGVLRVRSNSHQPSPEPESAGGNTVGASAAGAASAAAATAATERAASGVFEFGPDILNVDDHLEYVVSSRFIAPVPSKYGPYGTRSQTVMVVWEDGLVECRERYIDVMGHQDGCAVGEVVDGCCMGDQDVPVWRQIVQKFHVEPQKL